MGKFIDIPDWLKLDNILEEETDDEIKIELQKQLNMKEKNLCLSIIISMKLRK